METDVDWGKFYADPKRFADTINCFGCDGAQFIDAGDIIEADSKVYLRVSSCARRKSTTRFRDVIRRVAFGVNFAIIGIENQETIDYSYPLREIIYSCGEYEKQASLIRKHNRLHNRANADSDGTVSPGEFLYSFNKTDRLKPCITFMLYSGIDEWDGPRTLYDMLDFGGIPESLRSYVQDYRLNIIEIRKIPDDVLDRLSTDVKQVFKFIKYSENKEALYSLIQNDEYYSHMDKDAFYVASNYANAREILREDIEIKDGEVNMCTAIKELMEDSRNDGFNDGFNDGLKLLISCLKASFPTAEDIYEQIKNSNQDTEVSIEQIKKFM